MQPFYYRIGFFNVIVYERLSTYLESTILRVNTCLSVRKR